MQIYEVPQELTWNKLYARFAGNKKPSGPRSNSSLTSKEVEFQNWKRRKSYDPMKAAAEGKKKAEAAKRQNVNPMTQSYHEANQDGDSSPSHSSSVHRSQVSKQPFQLTFINYQQRNISIST